MKTFLFLTILSVCGTLANGAPQGDRPVPHFSLWERILLKTISKSNPGLFKGVSVDEIFRAEPTPMAYPEHLYIDAYFVEYRQLLTQAIKISKEAHLPELDWEEVYDFCFWIYCFDYTLTLKSADSRMIGTQNTQSRSEVTPTSFKNTFFVPYVKWTSPNFQFNLTENTYEDVWSYQGYHIEAENFTLTVSSDYEYVDNIGIQLRNFSIGFDVANFTSRLDAFYQIDAYSGVIEKEGPVIQDLTEYSKESWEEVKDEYEKNLLKHINCLLSNTMSDPAACFPDEDKNYNAYYHFIVIQLMQTIGLGALLS